MYVKQIADIVADRINDETLSSTGTHYARTKAFMNEFMFLDLLPRARWKWARREGTVTTTSGTKRYSLPRWVDNPSNIDEILHPTSLEKLTQRREKDIEGRYSSTAPNSTPTEYVIAPRSTSTYSTGTISGTSATKVITGSGTDFVTAGIEQFDFIKVGSVVYTVDSVDSATQITIFEDIITTIAAATSYTAQLDRYQIDLYPTPDATIAFEVHAHNTVARLEDDTDIPVLPDRWHNIIVKGAVVLALKHNNDEYTQELAELESDIRKMIAEEDNENDYDDYIGIPRMKGTHLPSLRRQ